MRAKPPNSGSSSAIDAVKLALWQKESFRTFSAACISAFIILSFLTLSTTTDYSIGNFSIMNGLGYTLIVFSMNAVTSILIGLYAAIVSYRLNASKKSGKSTAGIFGIITGILGAGCPTCGSFIFGLFGAPLALYGLPFKGLEIKALSIILLSISVFLMSKTPASCKINKL